PVPTLLLPTRSSRGHCSPKASPPLCCLAGETAGRRHDSHRARLGAHGCNSCRRQCAQSAHWPPTTASRRVARFARSWYSRFRLYTSRSLHARDTSVVYVANQAISSLLLLWRRREIHRPGFAAAPISHPEGVALRSG